MPERAEMDSEAARASPRSLVEPPRTFGDLGEVSPLPDHEHAGLIRERIYAAAAEGGVPGHGGDGREWGPTTPLRGRMTRADADVEIRGALPGDGAGGTLAGCPDLNGDGADDLLLGAVGESTSAYAAGAAYLILGGGH